MFIKSITIADNERAFVIRNGRFEQVLKPGRHRFVGFGSLEFVRFTVSTRPLVTEWTDFLIRNHPETVVRHYVVAATGDNEIGVVTAGGQVVHVLGPGQRVLFWNEPLEIGVEVFDAVHSAAVPDRLIAPLQRLGTPVLWSFVSVTAGHKGLLYLNNKLSGELDPGTYAFWTMAQPRVELVDLRLQTLEVAGQEILTADKIGVRVNVTANFRIASAAKSREAVKDVNAFLYRVVQVALRQSLGRKTLEQLLEAKSDVDPAVVTLVRTELEPAGIALDSIAVRDIVLPGEIRDLVNQVVAAEKQAQANLIRRREETAATRSLLNTAKLMEENPLLVRLKELETLEKLSEKVERITVSGGFDGLLTNLLAESKAK